MTPEKVARYDYEETRRKMDTPPDDPPTDCRPVSLPVIIPGIGTMPKDEAIAHYGHMAVEMVMDFGHGKWGCVRYKANLIANAAKALQEMEES